MGFVLQDRILQPFLQIFSPLSGGRIDTFWSRRRTKQPHPGTIRPPSESGKKCKPEGTEGAGGRTETGGAGASEGRDRRAPGPKKSDAGEVGAGKAMWPGKGVERPGPEKATRRGRSREGDVAGKGRGKARAGKGKMPGLEEELCGGQRPEKRRLHTASGAEPPSGKFRSAG